MDGMGGRPAEMTTAPPEAETDRTPRTVSRTYVKRVDWQLRRYRLSERPVDARALEHLERWLAGHGPRKSRRIPPNVAAAFVMGMRA